MLSMMSIRACRSVPLPFRCSAFHLAQNTRVTFRRLTPTLTVFAETSLSQNNSVLASQKNTSELSLFTNDTTPFSFTLPHHQQSRSFSTSLSRASKELSDKGDVVYKGAISGMIRGVKIFSLSTSLIGLCLQPMLLFNSQELPTALKFVVGGFLNFFIFMNPFIIHYIAKKYVTELRWNRSTGTFTAVTWSLFAQRKELQFTAEDVRVPDVPGMFTLLEAKGVPLFMEPQAFIDNEAYIRLMGFDKPLDWELPTREGQEPQKESQKG